MTDSETVNLAIDLKYYRMRIYRTTLQDLGRPKYIQFLVNPMKKVIAIKPVAKMNTPDQTCRINWKQLEYKSYIEVKSKPFLRKLCADLAGMSEGKSYRLQGVYVPSKRIVVFPLEEQDHRKEGLHS